MDTRCRSEGSLGTLVVTPNPKSKPKLRRRPSQVIIDFINRHQLVGYDKNGLFFSLSSLQSYPSDALILMAVIICLQLVI